ncbi:hypothetical protein quinque_004628 [Culex quinquefasciatus]
MSEQDKQWLLGDSAVAAEQGPHLLQRLLLLRVSRPEGAPEGRKRGGKSKAHKDNTFYHPFSQQMLQRNGLMEPRAAQLGKERSGHKGRCRRETTRRCSLKTRSGKLQCGSVTAPRKIIDQDVVAETGTNSGIPLSSEVLSQRKSRQILLHVESLYKVLLKLEDLANPLAIEAKQLLKERYCWKRIQAVLKDVPFRWILWCTILASLTALPKREGDDPEELLSPLFAQFESHVKFSSIGELLPLLDTFLNSDKLFPLVSKCRFLLTTVLTLVDQNGTPARRPDTGSGRPMEGHSCASFREPCHGVGVGPQKVLLKLDPDCKILGTLPEPLPAAPELRPGAEAARARLLRGQKVETCTSPGGTDSCQLQSRKRRRGVIEKKRRDRINSSLTELKRLVPSAYEKQGSAKLEKAEILQLTVDHLKTLHARGLDDASYDPQRFAMDYHIIGFRECVAEVARYLVTIEGMDVQDPLRLRLMSHLQCFATQRELTTKATATSPAWSHATTTKITAPQSASSTTAPYIPQVATIAGHDHLAYGATGSTTDLYTSQHDNVQQQQQQSQSAGSGNSSGEQRTYTDISNSLHPPNRPDDGYGNPQYPVSSSTHGYSAAAAAAAAANYNNSSKPYRPWGAEMAC